MSASTVVVSGFRLRVELRRPAVALAEAVSRTVAGAVLMLDGPPEGGHYVRYVRLITQSNLRRGLEYRWCGSLGFAECIEQDRQQLVHARHRRMFG